MIIVSPEVYYSYSLNNSANLQTSLWSLYPGNAMRRNQYQGWHWIHRWPPNVLRSRCWNALLCEISIKIVVKTWQLPIYLWTSNSKHEHWKIQICGRNHSQHRRTSMNIGALNSFVEIMVNIKPQTWTFLWTRSWWTSVAWSSPLQLPCLSQQPTNRWRRNLR